MRFCVPDTIGQPPNAAIAVRCAFTRSLRRRRHAPTPPRPNTRMLQRRFSCQIVKSTRRDRDMCAEMSCCAPVMPSGLPAPGAAEGLSNLLGMANVRHFAWRSDCGGLFHTPIAA
jgi:hypothetical protein